MAISSSLEKEVRGSYGTRLLLGTYKINLKLVPLLVQKGESSEDGTIDEMGCVLDTLSRWVSCTCAICGFSPRD